MASAIDYPSERFDLVISMLSLHEMPNRTRLQAMAKTARVTKKDGRILLIDYHPDAIRFYPGCLYKVIFYSFEIAVGVEHYKNSRNFIRSKGIPGLVAAGKLTIEKMRVVGGGNFGFYLLKIGMGE